MKYRKQPATRMKALALLMIAASLLAAGNAVAEDPPVLGRRPFISYFKPTPINVPLSASAWGAATVGPRDQDNGLEDRTLQHWNYWDGVILKGADGRYRLSAAAGIRPKAMPIGGTPGRSRPSPRA